MYKTIAILLSNLILLQSLNIGLEDFSKIKVLVKHAQYHQETYGDSFIDFLVEHYGNDKYVAKNHKEHEKLPFKDSSKNCHHLTAPFTLSTQTFEIRNNLVLETQQNYFYKKLYSFLEKPSVFQPPKFA